MILPFDLPRLGRLVSPTIVVGILLSASSANALGPVTVEAAATLGGGMNPSLVTNPLGFGLGARAGVSFHEVYGGIMGRYYLGTTAADATVNPGTTAPSSLAMRGALEGVEVGYTFGTPVFRVRPLVGVGNSTLFARSSPPGTVTSESFDNVYIEPGVLLMVPIKMFFVGADLGVVILPRAMLAPVGYSTPTSYASFVANGQVGVRF